MEKRSLFKQIFGVNKQKVSNHQRLQMLNSFTPVWSKTNNIDSSSIVIDCVNTIATHASKFEMVHKQYSDGKITEINGFINYLLKYQPNPINTPSDFLYKVVYNWAMYNNSFIFIRKDRNGDIVGFYPITTSNCELLESDTGRIYLRFIYSANKQTYELPYDELIHIRRNYGKHEIFGDDNKSLMNAVEANETATQGITNAIKATAGLRGIIKFSNSILKESDMQKFKDKFVEDYLSLENESGIAVMDQKAEFIPVTINPITLNNTQLEHLEREVYRHFGLNASIVNSDYTDAQWSAFYESVLEPLAKQLEEAFTMKIFNQDTVRNGHRIKFQVERIKYNKTTTKVSLISALASLGLITIDEGRAIFDMAPIGGVEGGKRLQSLNYVNSEKADEYQVGDEGGSDE